MAATILADTVISISDLKKNPILAVAQGEGFPVGASEARLNKIEDLELNALADSRANQPRVEVHLDDL
jgi:antitoxin StbD